MSPASPIDPTPRASPDTDPAPPASEVPPFSDARLRAGAAREVQPTLPEEAFDFHDTIPAPPWLDEAGEEPDPPGCTTR